MRVIVYDRTCVRTRGRLSPIWATGARLFRGIGRIDDAHAGPVVDDDAHGSKA